MDTKSKHAVTVLVSRRVKAGCEADFERVTAQLIVAAAKFSGFLGAQLVHPGEEPEVEDGLYHVVLAFDSQAHLELWQHSKERSDGLGAAAPYIDGPATMRHLSGMALWFSGKERPFNPPRWKVAVVTWLGICPTVYLLFYVLGRLLAPWNLFPRVVVLTLLVVALMTWVVAPQLTRLFKPWLFRRPKPGT